MDKDTPQPQPRARRKRRWLRYALVCAAVLVLGVLWTPMVLGWLGEWLVVEDELKPAEAIAVLGGGTPFREFQAVQLYRQGFAPVIALAKDARPLENRALIQMKIQVRQGWEISRTVLIRSGIPESAIRITDDEVEGTSEELAAIARMLQLGGKPLILVTSKYHARRTRLMWRHFGGTSEPIVRVAQLDTFDPHAWWKNRQQALAVMREYLGILNFWAGFPVPAQKTTN